MIVRLSGHPLVQDSLKKEEGEQEEGVDSEAESRAPPLQRRSRTLRLPQSDDDEDEDEQGGGSLPPVPKKDRTGLIPRGSAPAPRRSADAPPAPELLGADPCSRLSASSTAGGCSSSRVMNCKCLIPVLFLVLLLRLDVRISWLGWRPQQRSRRELLRFHTGQRLCPRQKVTVTHGPLLPGRPREAWLSWLGRAQPPRPKRLPRCPCLMPPPQPLGHSRLRLRIPWSHCCLLLLLHRLLFPRLLLLFWIMLLPNWTVCGRIFWAPTLV